MVGNQGKVYALEPIPRCYNMLLGALKENPSIKNITPINAAIGNNTGFLDFIDIEGGSSTASAEGDISVFSLKLDDLFLSSKITGPGVVKFDIEGFEMEALLGGIRFLQSKRPKIQISVYHKPEDLIDITMWLNEKLDSYAFFLAHHGTYYSETDLYVIPREQL